MKLSGLFKVINGFRRHGLRLKTRAPFKCLCASDLWAEILRLIHDLRLKTKKHESDPGTTRGWLIQGKVEHTWFSPFITDFVCWKKFILPIETKCREPLLFLLGMGFQIIQFIQIVCLQAHQTLFIDANLFFTRLCKLQNNSVVHLQYWKLATKRRNGGEEKERC